MTGQPVPHAAHLQDEVGAHSEACIDCVRAERDKAVQLSEQRQTRIEELEGELATAYKELRRAETTITDLTAQIEELEVSPLDLTQQQRAKALRLAREVVEETGNAGVFTKSPESKASLAGVLSTAHFIVSGERDYVTRDGEFVLESDSRPEPIQLKPADGKPFWGFFNGRKSGIEDVTRWLSDNLADQTTTFMADGRSLTTGALVAEIHGSLTTGGGDE